MSRCSKHPPAADELTQLTQLRASCCSKHCKQLCCSLPEHRGSGYAQGQNWSSVPQDIYPLGWEIWVSAVVEPHLSDQWIFSKLPCLDQDLSLLTSRGIFRLVGKSELCQDPWKALGLGECKGKGDGICLVRGLTAVLRCLDLFHTNESFLSDWTATLLNCCPLLKTHVLNYPETIVPKRHSPNLSFFTKLDESSEMSLRNKSFLSLHSILLNLSALNNFWDKMNASLQWSLYIYST